MTKKSRSEIRRLGDYETGRLGDWETRRLEINFLPNLLISQFPSLPKEGR